MAASFRSEKCRMKMGPGLWVRPRGGCALAQISAHITVLIRPTLLVTRHRHLRREEIGRMSRVPTKFEEWDKNFSLRGGFNTTENGKILT